MTCAPFRFTERWATLGPLLLADPAAAADELERHDQELEQHFIDCGCDPFQYTYRWATFVHALLALSDRAIDVMEQRDLELEEAVAHDPGCELRLTHRWREIAALVVDADARAWDLLEMRDLEIEEARSGCSCGCPPWTITTDTDFVWDAAGNSTSFLFDEAATVASLHFESPGGGSLFGAAVGIEFSFTVTGSGWTETFTFDATDVADGWSFDVTPAAPFTAGSSYVISVQPLAPGDGNVYVPIIAVLTIDGSCHDDEILPFGGG